MSKTEGKDETKNDKEGKVTKRKPAVKKKEVVVEKNAKVRYATGMTLNMGDFNSVRVDVDVTRFCEDTDGAVAAKLIEMQSFVDGELEAQVRKHRGLDKGVEKADAREDDDDPPFDTDDVKAETDEPKKDDLWD